MKQTVTITIDKAEVYTEVQKHTAYVGAKADETLYDKVRVKSGDKTMLERWWCDACGLVTTCFTPYVSSIATTPTIKDKPVETDDFKLTLSLPSNWNAAVKGDMERAANDLVTDYLLQQWYLLINAEAGANTASGKQQTAIAKVGQLLYARKRASRPTFPEDIYGQ